MIAPHVTSRSRLAAALTFSLLLHGALLWMEPAQKPAVHPASPLQIELPPPAPLPTPPASADPLLKNTLDADTTPKQPAAHRVLPPAAKHGSTALPSREAQAVAAARRKLSKYLIYPIPAKLAGLEGEVQLLITLDASGQVQSAEIATSSGHALLDRAALQAVYVMGRINANGVRQLLLPVQFKLI